MPVKRIQHGRGQGDARGRFPKVESVGQADGEKCEPGQGQDQGQDEGEAARSTRRGQARSHEEQGRRQHARGVQGVGFVENISGQGRDEQGGQAAAQASQQMGKYGFAPRGLGSGIAGRIRSPVVGRVVRRGGNRSEPQAEQAPDRRQGIEHVACGVPEQTDPHASPVLNAEKRGVEQRIAAQGQQKEGKRAARADGVREHDGQPRHARQGTRPGNRFGIGGRVAQQSGADRGGGVGQDEGQDDGPEQFGSAAQERPQPSRAHTGRP